jgi:ABC-type spermidine/putrescine transport system permease subunit II
MLLDLAGADASPPAQPKSDISDFGHSIGPWRRLVPRGSEQEATLAAILLAVFVLLVVPPLIWLVIGSVYSTGRDGTHEALTLANYADVLAAPALIESTVNSVTFALGSAVLALLLGGTLRWPRPGRSCRWRRLTCST